jgi:hypothetical protein
MDKNSCARVLCAVLIIIRDAGIIGIYARWLNIALRDAMSTCLEYTSEKEVRTTACPKETK